MYAPVCDNPIGTVHTTIEKAMHLKLKGSAVAQAIAFVAPASAHIWNDVVKTGLITDTR